MTRGKTTDETSSANKAAHGGLVNLLKQKLSSTAEGYPIRHDHAPLRSASADSIICRQSLRRIKTSECVTKRGLSLSVPDAFLQQESFRKQ